MKQLTEEHKMSHNENSLFSLLLDSGGTDIDKKTIIENEAILTCDDRRWSSMIHILALSSVLETNVISVYPEANVGIRPMFNATIQPASPQTTSRALTIMWSRDDNLDNRDGAVFQPNHFVALLIRDSQDQNKTKTQGNKRSNVSNTTINSKKLKSQDKNIQKPKGKSQQKIHAFFPNMMTSISTSSEDKSEIVTESPSLRPGTILPDKKVEFSEQPSQSQTPLLQSKSQTDHVDDSMTCSDTQPNQENASSSTENFDLQTDIGILAGLRHQLTNEQKHSILTSPSEKLSEYPSHGGKVKRRYNPSWEQTFSWLRYSPKADGAFCAQCVVFGPKSCPRNEFINTPFRDWKNATGAKRGMLKSHHTSKVHIDAQTANDAFLSICKGEKKSINEKISTAYAERIAANRKIMISIIDVIVRLSSRGLALRGTWDKEKSCEDSNFDYFVNWISQHEPTLAKHLTSCPGNAKYLSPKIQNDIIDCMGNHIRSNIVEDVAKSPFFSIMADETTDAGTVEQLSICVRYLSGLEVREEFLGFVPLPRTNAETITDAMIEHLQLWNLDLQKWRGKGFDGAATMSGHVSGVQARITSMFPKAKYFTHCASHCLNLVIVASCTNVPEIRNFMNTFKELTLFFSYSAKRKHILKTHMAKDVPDLLADTIDAQPEEILLYDVSRRQSLPTLSDTRWLSRVDSLSTLLVNYGQIYDALQDVNDESSGQSAHDATSYMHAMQRFENIVVAVVTQYTLGFVRPLSVSLQGKKCDLLKAHTDAQNIIQVLKQIRCEEKFEELYNRAIRIAATIEVTPTKPRTVGRQRHRANAAIEKTGLQEHYRLNYFNPFIDHMISHMTTRFPPELEGALKGTTLLPGHVQYVDSQLTQEVKDAFRDDLPSPGDFEQEVMRWKTLNEGNSERMTLEEGAAACNESFFPNISRIFQLILCLPVGSCTCERSFSSLRRLKTWNRTSMSASRLNGLAMAYIHRSNINVKAEDILKLWDATGHHRIALAFD